MRRTIHKVFFVWEFDKEEKWLNEMAGKGFALVSVGFWKYEFEDCMPGEYRICLQLLDNLPRHPESQKYMEFLEETGSEHVGSFFRWAYFRKKATDGEFELFSDNLTRIKYLSKVIRFIVSLTVLNWIVGIYNVFLAIGLSSSVNYLGFLNLAIGIWGTLGSIRLLRKRKRMKQESRLFE